MFKNIEFSGTKALAAFCSGANGAMVFYEQITFFILGVFCHISLPASDFG
jgi:hypothetical protein